MDAGKAIELHREIGELLAQDGMKTDPGLRKRAVGLGRALALALDEPANAATELMVQPYVTMSARIAVDMGLFPHIVQQQDGITTARLAELTGAEELLISRILRLLASCGLVEEAGAQRWRANAITKAMATEEIAAGHRFAFELLVGSAAKTPKYFKEVGYKSPTDPHDGLVQYAFQSKLQAFDLMLSIPGMMRDFTTFMGNTMGARKYWVEWYPVEERLISNLDGNSALVVDVGGGKGHDLEAFHKKFPNKGRLVLEDLPQVVEVAKDVPQDVQRVPYDFFAEQPVKGARAYFYHHILHDWADDKCLAILKQVRAAMRPGYSKLLLHELILPDVGAPPFSAILDLMLMTFNGGMERSRKQWTSLLEAAGFEVVKFWVDDDEADGIVEAVVRETKN